MNERSMHVLEFQKIREMLAERCVTEGGQAASRALVPYTTLPEIEAAQQETAEAREISGVSGGTPVQAFSDVTEALHLSSIGGALSPRMLMDVAAVLRAAKAARDALLTDREDTPMLRTLGEQLADLRDVRQDIADVIVSEDEIADRASSELFSIRRKMRACTDRVRDRLNSMIHSAAYSKYLQDAIITMRQDRYVLPVRQEYRAMVPGIVHDQSTSGATLFIEPMSVVEIGNERKQLMAAEKAEIDRILRKLSAEIAPYTDDIQRDQDILSQLDFIFAKASLGIQMEAVTPRVNEKGSISIQRGRHPLIDRDRVVPLDVRLGDTFTTLVITGPNTGGKTVTLKTIGLFCLMAQAGLQIPAEEGSETSVFEDVFADIGDEQSIEQSLSTFSGHMKNIVEILSQVTEKSLVLFDELGAGTDPTEGAALAQAILRYLLQMGTRTAATTHYSELKAFAMTTPGVENASVEFDVATLRPTYRLLVGIPGKSNAFEISKKLGLSDDLIESAKELLSKEQIRFEDVLANAEYHRQVAAKERELAEQAHTEMLEIRRQAERERTKLEEQRQRSLEKAKAEAKRIVENARREQENLIEQLRALKKAGGAQEHEIQAIRRKAEQAADELAEQDGPQGGGEPLSEVKVGDLVHVASMDIDATVTALPDAKGNVQLMAGRMKLRTPLSDLRKPTKAQKEEKKQKDRFIRRESANTRVDIMNRDVRRELDLRGLALNEAIPEVEKFIDDAVLSSLKEVSIIHGNGTGVLRQGIAECLRRHPSVSSYRAGRYGEGETGVTVVTLR